MYQVKSIEFLPKSVNDTTDGVGKKSNDLYKSLLFINEYYIQLIHMSDYVRTYLSVS